jgi:cell division protein FtsQ
VSGPPPKGRRRRRKSPARRLRPFWFLVVVVLLAGATGAYWLITWPALDPHRIEVTGNRIVSRQAILAAARVDPRRNMWLQNTRAMDARIEAIPDVGDASVRRLPPDVLEIAVTERVPYAVIDDGGTRFTVDRTLRVLQAGVRPGSETLPVLHVALAATPAPGATLANESAAALAAIADRAQAAHLAVASLADDRYGDVAMVLRSHVRVLLGDATQLDRRLAMVSPILAQVDRGHRRITTVDLRAITTPVVVYAK